jgi:hypothetical protein
MSTVGIDTSIYNNVRPFTMGDPVESAGKVMALQQMQKRFSMEDDIAAAGAASGGDPAKMAQALMSRGHYEPALKLQSTAATLAKEKKLAANAEIDGKLKLAEAAGSDALALDQVWRQSLQEAGGNPQMALQRVTPIYQQIRQKWASMGQELPENFDPDRNFASIGQAKEAVQYLKTLAPKKEDKPSSVREYEYAKSQGYTGTFQDYQLEQSRAKGTNVTVNAGGKKFNEIFASKAAEKDVEMLDIARKAPDLAERANSVLEILDTGKVVTGTGADFRLGFGKALGLVGGSDQETIANTESLVTELASTTLDAIKASGLGSGQGFTDKDRAFLEKAKAGQISLEESTIRRIAILNHRAAEKSAERWNKRVKEIPDSALEGTGITRDPITVSARRKREAKPAANPRAVTLPDGRTFNFPTPAAANKFRKEAGLE